MNFFKSIMRILFRWWWLIAVVTLLVSLFCSATAKWMGWIELEYESTKLGYDPWFLIIHKEAQIPTAPNYKSLVVVTLLALPLALIISVLLAYFADRRFPRVTKVSE